jgi:hypothetical protein
MSAALRNLLNVLDEKIDGLPDNPWIPGTNFADGKLEVAIEEGRKALSGDRDNEHPMVAAYHSLYDFKDAQERGSDKFVRAYESLSYMAQAMQDMGIVVPTRFDKADR